MTNNLDWWYNSGYLYQSRNVLRAKIEGLVDFNVFGFIDCHCPGTDIIQVQDIDEGSDAIRWNPKIQTSCYNGQNYVHGLKHQTIDCAYDQDQYPICVAVIKKLRWPMPFGMVGTICSDTGVRLAHVVM